MRIHGYTLRECLVSVHGIACYETTTCSRRAVSEWMAILVTERLVEAMLRDILKVSQEDVIRCLDGVAFS